MKALATLVGVGVVVALGFGANEAQAQAQVSKEECIFAPGQEVPGGSGSGHLVVNKNGIHINCHGEAVVAPPDTIVDKGAFCFAEPGSGSGQLVATKSGRLNAHCNLKGDFQ
jgi:hypothetical protein